jgi:hypothetical protein
VTFLGWQKIDKKARWNYYREDIESNPILPFFLGLGKGIKPISVFFGQDLGDKLP